MEMRVHGHDVGVSEALKEHCERRLGHALGKYRASLGRIDVHLTDVNGPRGGKDIECQVRTSIVGLAPIVVRALSDDAYASVDLAAVKASTAIARRLARERRSRHEATIRTPAPAPSGSPPELPRAATT